ncbi:MAG: heavy metal translocating P-type ATPase [Ardenticatenaceae bacterium]
MLSLTIGGALLGTLGTGITLLKRRQSPKLIEILLDSSRGTKEQKKTSPWQRRTFDIQQLTTKIKSRLAAADERYQHFVQTTIDPWLGKTRHAQMQEMLSEEALALSAEERFANHRLALGVLATGLAILGELLFPSLMPLAISVGLLAMWNNYSIAWRQWQQTKRLGNIHLICIYIVFLWLGGYATIGALGALLLGIALKVKAISENQSRNNLFTIFQLQPGKVWVRVGGSEVEIPFDQLQLGDRLVLHGGQIVPVDGTIVAGLATVDQHKLTGEAQPVEKSIGQTVLAGTLLISGCVDVRVEKTGTETTAGQIGEILNQTAQYNTTTALKVIEMADRFALPTLALSVMSWPLIGPVRAVSLMGANSTHTTYMSGTLAMLNFLNLAAENGILVKDGSALEQISAVDTIVFDKTGTLTLEQPHVAQVYPLNSRSEEQVLRWAAAAEVRQTHPIARAILAAARELDLPLPAIDQVHVEVGFGLKVRLIEDDQMTWAAENDQPPLIRVGSTRFMTMEGIALPAQVQDLTDKCQALGHSLVMVALDDELAGCLELQPTVRPEARQIIKGLQERGIALYIISGDQEAPTRKLAQELGITGYFANTLPEAKASHVTQLQQKGRHVCFIGDGINDSIAMRKAQVSISLRGATTAATDTAQIILMEGNLNQLLYLFSLADEFERNLQHNFRFTAGTSLAAVAGILLAGFTFAATEAFYIVSLLGGLGIAMKPLLDHQIGPSTSQKESLNTE